MKSGATATRQREKVIKFSLGMLEALEEGAKSQTRRVVKPQPPAPLKVLHDVITGSPVWAYDNGRSPSAGTLEYKDGRQEDLSVQLVKTIRCHYGDPGDLLLPRCLELPAAKQPTYKLEITAIRVERLQSISDEDAWAEGVHPRAFPKLWDSLHGKNHGWKANPQVWVLVFRKLPHGL